MLALALTLFAAAAPAQSGTLAIQADTLYLGDGRTLEKGILLIDEGKFRAVASSADLPRGVRLIQHKGAISPGFVSAHDQTSLGGEATDETRPMLAEALAAHGFDPEAKELRLAARAGVTTVLLSPSADSLVGGQTAVVKTAGGKILQRRSHLALSLSSSALRLDTPPTSPMGAVTALEAEFAANTSVYADVKAGRLPVMIHAVARHEILRSIEFATRNKLKGSIEGAPLAGELAEVIKESGLSVVLEPFTGGDSRREIRSVLALSGAGVPFAFGLDAPSTGPDALRLSAAMCLREGLDRKAIEKALFSDAASICGVGDRVGRLERGFDADFLLWSGDPLDLSSRLEAVYIDGARVDTSKP
ncbi:MAG TPA: amidohydrolase family protein [Planctomycetota bacterium]|nr:amidohydrolase family protein [Planctomycetota bacterium]